MTTDLLARVTALTGPDPVPDPRLLTDLAAVDDPLTLQAAGRMLAEISVDLLAPRGLRPLRVAVTAAFTADRIVSALRATLLCAGIVPEFHVAPINQIGRELSSRESDLVAFSPDITLCLLDDETLVPRAVDLADLDALHESMRQRAGMLAAWLTGFAGRGAGHLLLHTVPLPGQRLRNVVSLKARARLGRVWRETNTKILRLAETTDGVSAVDLELLLTDRPTVLRDERLYRFARLAWSPDVELLFAREAAAACRAYLGLSRKCLVLDLDNTLWGGTVGDDGPSGVDVGPVYPGNCYADFQGVVAALRSQGVILATASKNDPAIVRRTFGEHPEFLLRYEDFVAHAENWDDKNLNIAAMAEELGVGLDSVVFADDSEFECGLVRATLPQVEVIHLNGDPAKHTAALLDRGLFDVLDLTTADRDRTALYQARGARAAERTRHGSTEDYLGDLGLRVSVFEAGPAVRPRVTQLGRRTNQFNLTGRDPACLGTHRLLAYRAVDRFGDDGLVGAVWIAEQPRQWVIENWVMSCRVMSRGIEFAVLHHIAEAAGTSDVPSLAADFVATDRNRPARTFLTDAGFVEEPRTSSGQIRYTLALPPRRRLLPAWIQLDQEGGRARG